MYSELEVQFLTDECDTVLAYENKGTSDQETERRDPLMDTLNSMNRVQQVELICGKYNFIFRICPNTLYVNSLPQEIDIRPCSVVSNNSEVRRRQLYDRFHTSFRIGPLWPITTT